MPAAPADPLDWSIEQVQEANFMASAAYAGSLCRKLEAGENTEEHSARLVAMLSHSDGARGFFVTYLTDPRLTSIADDPKGLSPLVSEAIRGANPEVVVPLAIMNLVMPTATALAHETSGDTEAASHSRLTARRGMRVLQVLLSDGKVGPAVRSVVEAAHLASAEGAGDGSKEWTAFFSRWKYNDGQMAAIRKTLDAVLASEASQLPL